MKILVVSQYYSPEPFRISDICETLVSRGHEVTVLTGYPNYPEGKIYKDFKRREQKKEKKNGVEIIRSFELARGKNKVKLFLNYVSFAISGSFKIMTLKKEYDVILVNQLSPVMMAIPGIIYKRKKRKKMIMYCLDLWPASLASGGVNKDGIIYNFFSILSKYIYDKSDEILVTSQHFISYLKHELKVNSKFVHLPQYAENLFENISVKLEKNNFNLVFAGNIGEMQSVETIIEAAKLLISEEEIVFHIVGDGSKLNFCKGLAKSYNLKNVKFYGRHPLEDMHKFYSFANAMLITLKQDELISLTLPGKIQSYMAASKPIIGAIDGECNKVIRESKSGYVCSAENYKELAKIILKAKEAMNYFEVSSYSKKYYDENYIKESFMVRLEEVLKRNT